MIQILPDNRPTLVRFDNIDHRFSNHRFFNANNDEVMAIDVDSYVTVLNFALAAGNYVKIKYGIGGVSSVTFTEGVDFSAGASNTECASNLTDAINSDSNNFWTASYNNDVVTIKGKCYILETDDATAFDVYNNRINTGGNINTTGNITVSDTNGLGNTITGTAASTMEVIGAGIDLTLDSDGGRLILNGGEAASDAIVIEADDLAGGIDINCGTGGLTLDSTGIISFDSEDDSNLTMSANDASDKKLTIESSNAGAGEGLIDITSDVTKFTGWVDTQYLNRTKYYWCDDFDEENTGVTLAACMRNGEWITGGTNSVAGHFVYLPLIGGILRITTAGADNDSDGAYHIPLVNTGVNPIIEFRFKTDNVSANQNGVLLGLTELPVILDINNIPGVSNDYIAVGINSDLSNPANVRLFTDDNAGGAIVDDLGVAISAATYCTVRIDCTDTEQPRVWVNNTGGAIGSPDEIAAGSITGTIQDNIYMYPFIFVQTLDATPSTAELAIDYIKLCQDRG